MMSNADADKPARSRSTRSPDSSAARSSDRKPSTRSTSTQDKRTAETAGSSRTKSGKRSTSRKKRSPATPDGPAVYASDVRAGATVARPSEGSASTLPDRVENGGYDVLELSPIESDLPMEHRPAQVLRLAEEAFAMTGSWVVFYRTMLAPGGVVHQLYDNPTSRRYFETTREFAELLEMVTAIRSQDDSSSGTHEPTRMVTIRVPRSLHEATIQEAKELELSINAYCVTKLLQPANPRFTPLELGKRRGRRAGPQMTLKKVKVKTKSKRRPKS